MRLLGYHTGVGGAHQAYTLPMHPGQERACGSHSRGQRCSVGQAAGGDAHIDTCFGHRPNRAPIGSSGAVRGEKRAVLDALHTGADRIGDTFTAMRMRGDRFPSIMRCLDNQPQLVKAVLRLVLRASRSDAPTGGP